LRRRKREHLRHEFVIKLVEPIVKNIFRDTADGKDALLRRLADDNTLHNRMVIDDRRPVHDGLCGSA